MGILFAVLNSVLLAVANVLLKKSFKDFSPAVSFFTFSLFALVLWSLLGLKLGISFENIVLGFFVGGISAVFGQLIYIYVLSKGELSITATILSTFSIFTILFSMLFNNERLDGLSLLFILLAITGTVIVSLPEREQFKKKDLQNIHAISWAVFGAFCIGVADTITKAYITHTSVGSFLFYTSIAQFIISFIYLKLQKEKLNQFKLIIDNTKDYLYPLLGSMLIAVSTMCLFLAFNYTLASIASPISATYPAITVVLALIFLKEKLSRKNMVGVLLVLIAILGVGFINI